VGGTAAVTRAAPPAGAPERVVRIDALRKRYGSREAVAGVSLAVTRGETYGLIGPDGAGKSSVLKALAGVLTFDGGTLSVFGRTLAGERDAALVQARLGFMPQGLGLNLYQELSVEENIDFFADLHGVTRADLGARKARLLATTRLEPFRARPMKLLSGGMKQKLGLACTLIHEPELVILDEPTTGIDPLSRGDFWRLLAELTRARAMTAIVSTAYLDEADRFDRIGLMHRGALLAEGTPQDLRRSLRATAVTLPHADAAARVRLAGAFGAVDRHGDGASVLVQSPDADADVDVDVDADAALTRVRAVLGAQVRLQAREATLEDLFVARLREREPAPAALLPAASVTRSELRGDAVEARLLSRTFGRFRAVDGVSFRVAPGEILGLLGANGAGKTTVIKMLTGILPPTSGSGHVAGADMRRAPLEIRRRIGYVSQAFSLYADLSARDNLLLYAGVYGLHGSAARNRVAEVAALGGLGAHRGQPAGSLPMGVRQRLALACALLHRPQVLFLDEPTAGVDPLGRREFWNLLAGLARDEGVAILLTTHHMAEAEHCDRLVLMHEGRVVADASPAVLKRTLRRPGEPEPAMDEVFARIIECAQPDPAARCTPAGEGAA
jgi:ABC-2 type transport system ATP-binding protein